MTLLLLVTSRIDLKLNRVSGVVKSLGVAVVGSLSIVVLGALPAVALLSSGLAFVTPLLATFLYAGFWTWLTFRRTKQPVTP